MLDGPLAAGRVDEDPPHSLGGGGEEVAAGVPPAAVRRADQPQVRLVDQGGGIQRVIRDPGGHAGGRIDQAGDVGHVEEWNGLQAESELGTELGMTVSQPNPSLLRSETPKKAQPKISDCVRCTDDLLSPLRRLPALVSRLHQQAVLDGRWDFFAIRTLRH
jgi:hypothetical protein